MRPTETRGEAEILAAVANGDRKAFSLLFYRFHQELGAFITRITKSDALAEEIVQDTFMKVWTNRHTLADVRNFRAFLFTIARNHSFNALRDETQKKFRLEALSSALSFSDTADDSPDKEVLFGIVDKAVSQLPPQQQKVWRMSKEQGLAYHQIAESLQLSPETVKRHISLAMASVSRYVRMSRCEGEV
ncbi:RNA polymerase sigma-70 factor [Ravibacter arvi]|uniref:RNA polymerase sigma factor n=1 Tax=Ravibacter arvi TaxID=2051041 RepID=A0ABP8ME40_9BACT